MRPHRDHQCHAAAIARLARRRPLSVSGDFYRFVSSKRSPEEFVSGKGSVVVGARWTPIGAFPALYASSSPELATTEFFAGARRDGVVLSTRLPRLLIAVHLELQRVLDMRDGAALRELNLTQAKVCADRWWIPGPNEEESLCQSIGRAAYEAGFEGLAYRSCAPGPATEGWNMGVFPDILLPGSAVRLVK